MIRTETEVLDCSQSADAVEVEVRRPDGKRERIKGRYLIGADGARSTVRSESASNSKASLTASDS